MGLIGSALPNVPALIGPLTKFIHGEIVTVIVKVLIQHYVGRKMNVGSDEHNVVNPVVIQKFEKPVSLVHKVQRGVSVSCPVVAAQRGKLVKGPALWNENGVII